MPKWLGEGGRVASTRQRGWTMFEGLQKRDAIMVRRITARQSSCVEPSNTRKSDKTDVILMF